MRYLQAQFSRLRARRSWPWLVHVCACGNHDLSLLLTFSSRATRAKLCAPLALVRTQTSSENTFPIVVVAFTRHKNREQAHCFAVGFNERESQHKSA